MTIIEILNYIENYWISEFTDLHIIDNSVVCFYKTHTIKYTNVNNQIVSYLFPTTFSFRNGKLETSMIFGSVERNFTVPRLKEDCSYSDGTILTTIGVGNHLYKLVIAYQSNEVKNKDYNELINIKPFQCAILGLDQIGFPFMRITNSNNILKT
jgi:hypothetical protein